MVRRVLPYAIPTVGFALAVGTAVGGWGVGWSAAIGVSTVVLNLVAHGWSLSWAARISQTMLFAVALGGFVARLGTILVVLILLNRLPWFSAGAFVAAVVPATDGPDLVVGVEQLPGLAVVEQGALHPMPPRSSRTSTLPTPKASRTAVWMANAPV